MVFDALRRKSLLRGFEQTHDERPHSRGERTLGDATAVLDGRCDRRRDPRGDAGTPLRVAHPVSPCRPRGVGRGGLHAVLVEQLRRPARPRALDLVKTVAGRETFAPLFPFVTSLGYPIVGRGVFGSLLVMPLFFAGLVAATFALARQLVSDSWAVVAALVVAALPAVTDYTRLFHFALPATACMTAALWALMRSDGLRRARWAVAFGLFVALTLLSRTMTVAYAPGLALAAGTQFLVGARRSPRQVAQPRDRHWRGCTARRALVHPQRSQHLRQPRGRWIRRERRGLRAPLSDRVLGLLDEGAAARPVAPRASARDRSPSLLHRSARVLRGAWRETAPTESSVERPRRRGPGARVRCPRGLPRAHVLTQSGHGFCAFPGFRCWSFSEWPLPHPFPRGLCESPWQAPSLSPA